MIDVAGITSSQRAAVARHIGSDQLFAQAVALFVIDYDLRCGLALDRLFPTPGQTGLDPIPAPASDPAIPVVSSTVAAPGVGAEALMAGLDEVLRAVARLGKVDAVTTELVRLRGARHHNCRFCQSIRSASAVNATGGAQWFEQVEAYESSDLSDSGKVALRLADAILSHPADIDDGLVTAVLSHFDDAQTVELVLDIYRNSSQKVAVSLGADQPRVASGIELFEMAHDGSVVFTS